MLEPKYRRVVLKLSGEALGGGGYGINPEVVNYIAQEISSVQRLGVELAIVVGGGTSGAVPWAAPRAWIAALPTTWACWPR